MNDAYSTSPYSGNRIESMASILGKLGYNTHFYHGGKNGTMGFDSYAKLAGFDSYYGLDEYPDKKDFDGSWGVYDIPYFQYLAAEQDKLKEPFLTAVFSLSAHHPYKLPADYKSVCPKGKLPIHPTICYSDDALRHYFGRIKNTAWYKNTVFIITADHTAQSTNKKYNTTKGIYAIPLVLFDPSKDTFILIKNTVQQADITPTALDYLGLPATMIAFGKSGIDKSQNGMAVNYLSGLYQLIQNDHTILFDGEELVAGYKNDSNSLDVKSISKPTKVIIESEKKLKAIIQAYNNRMIDNKLTLDE
jgi:phosphoglycerol transferase MdoB-like AlkP superfamily enzyme